MNDATNSAAFYHFQTYDERDNNFVTMRDNLDGGPLIYCAYLDLLCFKCFSIDKEALFTRKRDLEGGPKIKVSKGREFAEARDGFLVIKSRILELLKKYEVTGYVTRSIPFTDWHLFRVTTKVAYKNFKPERQKPACEKCGRGSYYGIATALRDIAVPEHPNTFFTPEIERKQTYDLYMTERVALMLKNEGAKGGILGRLLTDEECDLLLQGTTEAKRKIKGQQIVLS